MSKVSGDIHKQKGKCSRPRKSIWECFTKINNDLSSNEKKVLNAIIVNNNSGSVEKVLI